MTSLFRLIGYAVTTVSFPVSGGSADTHLKEDICGRGIGVWKLLIGPGCDRAIGALHFDSG